MKIENFKLSQQKIAMHKLFYEAESEFKKLTPTKGFKSINIFRGWTYYVEEWFIRRLDSEINKNDDFVQITDIKYKLNELRVSYISDLGIDYDEFIESYYRTV